MQLGLARPLAGVSRLLVLVILGAPRLLCQGQVPTPVLVELFTSEGCSSCPPADRLLKQFDASQPVAHVRLIVLSEHVDYFDDLGWRDPYSLHLLTVRQENYAGRFDLPGPYTPQMVIDGRYQVSGNSGREASQAVEQAGSLGKVGIRISALRLVAGEVRARLDVDPLPARGELYTALALDYAESRVDAGENRGRHLEHVGVVTNLSKLGKIGKGEAFSREISIPWRLPEKSAHPSYRLVAFIQEPNQGRVLGSAAEHIPQ